MRPRFVKQDQIAIVRLDISGGMSCIENFKDFPQMGRFTLRDEGKNCIIYYRFLIYEFLNSRVRNTTYIAQFLFF